VSSGGSGGGGLFIIKRPQGAAVRGTHQQQQTDAEKPGRHGVPAAVRAQAAALMAEMNAFVFRHRGLATDEAAEAAPAEARERGGGAGVQVRWLSSGWR
jgi:hypothetical protein